MATRRMVNVNCPHCSKESSFTMWQNIDSVEDPMLKQQIIDGTILDFKCPYCDYSVALHYDLLVNLRDDGVMLHMIANPEDAAKLPGLIEEQEKMLPVEAQAAARLYVQRIVPDLATLREKILIFDADLDDRVIELMKVVYSGQFAAQRGFEPAHVFFDVNEKGERVFELYSDDDILATAPVDKDLYNSLQHAPKRKLKAIRKDRVYFVNKEWALKSVE